MEDWERDARAKGGVTPFLAMVGNIISTTTPFKVVAPETSAVLHRQRLDTSVPRQPQPSPHILATLLESPHHNSDVDVNQDVQGTNDKEFGLQTSADEEQRYDEYSFEPSSSSDEEGDGSLFRRRVEELEKRMVEQLTVHRELNAALNDATQLGEALYVERQATRFAVRQSLQHHADPYAAMTGVMPHHHYCDAHRPAAQEKVKAALRVSLNTTPPPQMVAGVPLPQPKQPAQPLNNNNNVPGPVKIVRPDSPVVPYPVRVKVARLPPSGDTPERASRPAVLASKDTPSPPPRRSQTSVVRRSVSISVDKEIMRQHREVSGSTAAPQRSGESVISSYGSQVDDEVLLADDDVRPVLVRQSSVTESMTTSIDRPIRVVYGDKYVRPTDIPPTPESSVPATESSEIIDDVDDQGGMPGSRRASTVPNLEVLLKRFDALCRRMENNLSGPSSNLAAMEEPPRPQGKLTVRVSHTKSERERESLLAFLRAAKQKMLQNEKLRAAAAQRKATEYLRLKAAKAKRAMELAKRVGLSKALEDVDLVEDFDDDFNATGTYASRIAGLDNEIADEVHASIDEEDPDFMDDEVAVEFDDDMMHDDMIDDDVDGMVDEVVDDMEEYLDEEFIDERDEAIADEMEFGVEHSPPHRIVRQRPAAPTGDMNEVASDLEEDGLVASPTLQRRSSLPLVTRSVHRDDEPVGRTASFVRGVAPPSIPPTDSSSIKSSDSLHTSFSSRPSADRALMATQAQRHQHDASPHAPHSSPPLTARTVSTAEDVRVPQTSSDHSAHRADPSGRNRVPARMAPPLVATAARQAAVGVRTVGDDDVADDVGDVLQRPVVVNAARSSPHTSDFADEESRLPTSSETTKTSITSDDSRLLSESERERRRQREINEVARRDRLARVQETKEHQNRRRKWMTSLAPPSFSRMVGDDDEEEFQGSTASSDISEGVEVRRHRESVHQTNQLAARSLELLLRSLRMDAGELRAVDSDRVAVTAPELPAAPRRIPMATEDSRVGDVDDALPAVEDMATREASGGVADQISPTTASPTTEMPVVDNVPTAQLERQPSSSSSALSTTTGLQGDRPQGATVQTVSYTDDLIALARWKTEQLEMFRALRLNASPQHSGDSEIGVERREDDPQREASSRHLATLEVLLANFGGKQLPPRDNDDEEDEEEDDSYTTSQDDDDASCSSDYSSGSERDQQDA